MFVQQFPVDHVIAGSTGAVEGGSAAARKRSAAACVSVICSTAAIGVPLVGLAAYLIVSSRRPANASESARAGQQLRACLCTVHGGAAMPSPPRPRIECHDGAPSSSASATPVSNGAAATRTTPIGGTAATVSQRRRHPRRPQPPQHPRRRQQRIRACQLGLNIASVAPPAPAGCASTATAPSATSRHVKTARSRRRRARLPRIDVGDAGPSASINGRPRPRLGKPGEVVVGHITRANWQNWLQR